MKTKPENTARAPASITDRATTKSITSKTIRALRPFTAAFVIALCGFSLWRGFDLLQFADAERAALESGDATLLQRWRTTAGVGDLAASTALRLESDNTGRRQATVDLLSSKAMSSRAWLQLAADRLAAGAPAAGVASAFSMSVVTGPNEGDVMSRRALFGLTVWETIQPEMQSVVVRNLAVAPFAASGEWPAIVSLLSVKSAETRDAVRAQLLATGTVTSRRISELGL